MVGGWGLRHKAACAAALAAAVVKALEWWKQDPDLTGVREVEGIEALPEAEREEWRELWAEVDALLAKARGQAPGISKGRLDDRLPTEPFAR